VATFGEEHANVATALFGIAELHAARGDPATAESLHRRVLEMRIELPGEDHDRVKTSRKALVRVTGGEPPR
jgi:hypothetical protein